MAERSKTPTPSPRRPEPRSRDELSATEQHPVAFGLIALLGVGLVIGLILAGGVLLAAKSALGGGEQAADEATQQQSMYLPTPSPTEKSGGPGPLVSLQPQSRGGSESGEDRAINLTAGQSSVSPMERIDLTGTYDEEGAILQVERFADGSWGEFPVNVSVSGGTFSTYVQTSSTGAVKFRVVDSNTGDRSNAVTVQIG